MSLSSSSPSTYRLSSREEPAAKVRSFHLVREDEEPQNDHLQERVSLPRGWYEVPGEPTRQRFWDGKRFVAARPTPPEELEAAQAALAEAATDRSTTGVLPVVGIVCGVLAAIVAIAVGIGVIGVWWAAAAAALGAGAFAILGHTAQWPSRSR